MKRALMTRRADALRVGIHHTIRGGTAGASLVTSCSSAARTYRWDSSPIRDTQTSVPRTL